MIKTLRENKLLTALLLLGFVCALVLCVFRVVMEAKNNRACVVMSTEDLAKLSGMPQGVQPFDGGSYLDGTLLLVEDENQYSYRPYDAGVLSDDLRSVRCFKLDGDYAARYAVLGYPSAEEIENILYRAVTDRNIRVVWLTPFISGETGEMVTNAILYSELYQNLSARLERQGISLAEDFSVFEDYEPNFFLLLGAMLGVFAAGVLLIRLLCKLPKWLSLVGIAVCPAVMWKLPLLAVPLFALAASILFPCLALWYMTDRLAALRRQSFGKEAGAYIGMLFSCAGICIAGGLMVGALQSSSDYLLAVSNFRGVKLSQAAPVAFALVLVFRRFYGREGIRDILAGKKALLILAALVLTACVGYYILRTGNFSVSVLEQRLRNDMEHLLLVRPRTKEFLVAWPCLAAAASLMAAGKKRWVWPFAILSSAGFASVVNTFCHSRSPLWLSLTRTAYGLLFGGLLGLVLLLTVFVFRPKRSMNK